MESVGGISRPQLPRKEHMRDKSCAKNDVSDQDGQKRLHFAHSETQEGSRQKVAFSGAGKASK